MLEKCKEMSATLRRTLSKEVPAVLYDSVQAMLVDGPRAAATRKVAAFDAPVLYAAAPAIGSIPSDLKPGDFLIGQFALCKDDKYAHHAHVHYPIGAVKGSNGSGSSAPRNDDGATPQARLENYRWTSDMERLSA